MTQQSFPRCVSRESRDERPGFPLKNCGNDKQGKRQNKHDTTEGNINSKTSIQECLAVYVLTLLLFDNPPLIIVK